MTQTSGSFIHTDNLIQLYGLNFCVEGIYTLFKRWNSIEIALMILTFLVVFLSKILQRLNVRDDPPFSILTNSIPFLKTQPSCMLSQSCGGTGYSDWPPSPNSIFHGVEKKFFFFLTLHIIVNGFPSVYECFKCLQ